MTTLYDTLLPHLQAINEAGGNFVAFGWGIVDQIDNGAAVDRDLAAIRAS